MHKKNDNLGETDFEASLRAIEDAYVAGLPGRLDEIENCLQRCLEEPDTAGHYDALVLQLHSLAGSAGTFGFSELGFRATDLEIQMNAFIKEAVHEPGSFTPIATGVGAFLRWAVANAKAKGAIPPAQPSPPPAPRPPVEAGSQRLIYLVHDNTLVARDIAGQLQYFGYEVVIITELARLQEYIDTRIPAAVVMDLGFPAGILAGAAEVARIKQANAHRFAVIFISTRSNFEARLATVRAGADGYFSKPLDMVALIDRLDALTVQEEQQPCRILIIDDDLDTARHYAAVLRGAGMDVHVLDKIPGMLQTLGEYRPELVLMDVYMPECNGIDLARLIRQDNMYLDVPIVFLSSESDFEKQLDAIESGGDDFLTKPIQPAHLVSALTSRVLRYRGLRGLIMRDSLTGLYNHSAIKENLSREIARSTRALAPLTLAMVDIDHFKRINDTYGHPVGDQVIRALARLLQQRLRRGDIIGRYGGEEFAVIMPGTPAQAAAHVLDQIRESFSMIRHYSEARDFTATFSAGVAEITADTDTDELFRVADLALYKAKHDGRNCIRNAP
ncbi:diguanylate cyclase [Noviherbaspirillum sp. ST9]|uniref:diguanylate cyclase n=1 Tax=Noviherbaspirillum sp. ST9 TaxID=3401606 RepID=UPI003B58A73D